MPYSEIEKGRYHCHQRISDTGIDEFTKALEIPNLPVTVQIDLLDNRAAAQGEIEIGGTVSLKLALQDAEAMIQLSTVDARRYLRKGKIFELLDEDNSALDIYMAGIKFVGNGPHVEV